MSVFAMTLCGNVCIHTYQDVQQLRLAEVCIKHILHRIII